jgi:hypothetical protein
MLYITTLAVCVYKKGIVMQKEILIQNTQLSSQVVYDVEEAVIAN